MPLRDSVHTHPTAADTGNPAIQATTIRRLRAITIVAAIAGSVIFLAAVVVHPKRDGTDIAEVGQLYGLTHGVEAVGLILQVIALCGVLALSINHVRPRDLTAIVTALLGTVWYFGLIVVDGTRNPVTARYAPTLVHTAADIDTGTAIIVLPALLLFPLGHVLLGLHLGRHGARRAGLFLGAGAVIYITGGFAIFGLGPTSPAIEVLEIIGAIPYSLGVIMTARFWARPAAGSEA